MLSNLGAKSQSAEDGRDQLTGVGPRSITATTHSGSPDANLATSALQAERGFTSGSVCRGNHREKGKISPLPVALLAVARCAPTSLLGVRGQPARAPSVDRDEKSVSQLLTEWFRDMALPDCVFGQHHFADTNHALLAIARGEFIFCVKPDHILPAGAALRDPEAVSPCRCCWDREAIGALG